MPPCASRCGRPALPAVASTLLMTVFATVDALWVGRFLGPVALAAVSTSVFWIWLIIAVISILYGSAMAFTQTNLRLIAGYSSIAQLGFIVLGVFALNPQGTKDYSTYITRIRQANPNGLYVAMTGDDATAFYAEYAISYLGLPVGSTTFRSSFKDDRFAMEGSMASAGLAQLSGASTILDGGSIVAAEPIRLATVGCGGIARARRRPRPPPRAGPGATAATRCRNLYRPATGTAR